MAENNPKKKRFVYKSVVGNKQPLRPKTHEPALPMVDFPDDFDSLTQPSKKAKLDLEITETKDRRGDPENLFSGIKDDFDSFMPPPLKQPKVSLKKSAKKNNEDPENLFSDMKDDLDSFLSQPSKPLKLNLEKPKKKINGNENLLNDINFDDDFDDADFDLNEIDQIEIAASQQLGIRPKPLSKLMPRVDALDQLLEDTQSTSKALSVGRKSSVSQPKDRPGKVNTPKINGENKNSTVYLPLSQRLDANRNKSLINNPVNKNFGESSKAPASTNRQELEKSFQKQYHHAQKTLTEYKSTVENLQKKFNSKDGEIKILREKLRKSSEDELKLKEKLVFLEGSSKVEQSKKESDLVKEVEKLKTQLKFKEQEVKDAIQKHKQQLEKPKRPAIKSPSRGSNVPDGFRDEEMTSCKSPVTVKINKTPSKLTKNTCDTAPTTIRKIDRTKWKQFNTSLQRNTHNAKFSNVLIKKLSNLSLVLDYSFSLQHPDYQCNHVKSFVSPFNLSTFVNDIQASVELIDQSEYFIPDFIRKIVHYLDSIKQLFHSQSEKNNTQEGSTTSRKSSDGVPCIHCSKLYEIGLTVLFVIKESCQAYNELCSYLLSCFVSRRSKSKKASRNKEQVISAFIYIAFKLLFGKGFNTT